MFTSLPESSNVFQSVTWKHYVALWKLVTSLDNKHVTKKDISTVHANVTDYLSSFLVFKNYINERHHLKLNVTPKHLWLTAYPRLMTHVGSLSSLDTNIGEMKNFHMKFHSQRANQTINTIKTISLRESQRFSFDKKSFDVKHSLVPTKRLDIDILNEDLRAFLETNDFTNDTFDFYQKANYLGCIFRSNKNCGIFYQKVAQTEFGVLALLAVEKISQNTSFIVNKTVLSSVRNLCLKKCRITPLFEIVRFNELVLEKPVFVYDCKNSMNQNESYISFWKE